MSMRTCMHGISVSLECDGCKTLDSIESQLAAAKAEVESYRDCLADMHGDSCRFDDPPATDGNLECMACWVFETVGTKPLNNKRLLEAFAEISQCETVEYARIVAQDALDGDRICDECSCPVNQCACDALDGGKA